MNWQYKIIEIIPGRTAENLKRLNVLGADGWEAVHFTKTSVILKRAALAATAEAAQPEWFDSMPKDIKNQITRLKSTL
jgi:hypothetical protein